MEKYQAFINSVSFRTSKDGSHSYIVYDKLQPEQQYIFREFVQYIRDHGYFKSFYGHTYQYLDVGLFSYWTMGNPINETTILNRVSIKGTLE